MTGVNLRILGSAGSYPAPARACSSYLLQGGGSRVLLDCGSGSLANLQRFHRVDELSAVVVSHRHIDHMADLVSLYHILRFRPDGPGHITVYAPPSVIQLMDVLVPDEPMLREVCDFQPVRAGDRCQIGVFDVSFHHTYHPVDTVATRLETSGVVVAYSGDSGPGPELLVCARDADLFLCESTWVSGRGARPKDLHLTAAEAGRLAAEAGARELLVTHVAHPAEPDTAAAEASMTFGRRVRAAHDLEEFTIGTFHDRAT